MQAEGKIILYHDYLVSVYPKGFRYIRINHRVTGKSRRPACSSQAKKLDGGSHRECFVSDNGRKWRRHHTYVQALGQTQPPPTPWSRAPASWALESICSAPWGALAPKPSFSSPSPSSSPATGLQIAHGDIPNIHLAAKSNEGGIKRACTIREASTAAHKRTIYKYRLFI